MKFFIHIPKAAGTTFESILRTKIKGQYYRTNDFVHFKKAFEQFKNENHKDISIIGGHFPYGVHTLLNLQPSYFTFLRDPVERVISHYYYVLREKNHYLHKKVTEDKMSLAEYIKSGICTELNNGQVRLLSGYGILPEFCGNNFDIRFGECPDSMLDHVLKNIDNGIKFIGITEKFDESLKHLSKFINLDLSNNYQMKNVTDNRPQKSSISDEALELINFHNKLDIKLYNLFKNTL